MVVQLRGIDSSAPLSCETGLLAQQMTGGREGVSE